MTQTALATIEPDEHDRQKCIGGSDIAAVLGISPWKTPIQLWKDKTTPRVENADSGSKKKLFRRGQRWESVVAEMLVEHLTREGHKVEVIAANKRYKDATYGYFASEIDYEVRLDDEPEITNVELKTVHPFAASNWGESGTDDAPIWYVAQAMWGLGITGRQKCLIAPLFGADEIKTFPVMADAATIDAMRAKAVKFWVQHVQTGAPPDPVALSDMELLYPKESEAGALLADEELISKLLRMRAIDREIKSRTAELDALEFEVKRVMRDCSEIVIPGDKSAVTWKERAHSYLDQTALKEARPKLVREFTRKGSSRVFTLKSFAWKD